ncbi:MAG: hypothetical protein WD645_02605, partial [Dehalococcoidia bacterium]
EVCALAGLKLTALDSGPLAAARAANIEEGVVVQAEVDGGDVVVIKDGGVGLVRSAYWGGDIFDEEALLARVVDLAERSVASHNEANPGSTLHAEAPAVILGAAADMLSGRVEYALGRGTARAQPPLEFHAGLPMGELAANVGMALRSVR